ncbi:hypothetical protein [Lysobacter brunescens]|uniref:HEAT repeat domain-containing protein n=1 Tax=Lysobacter brunescens TaxID=262323 RepID=A0ABW2YG95_9GAMM
MKRKILSEMADAVARHDWQASYDLLGFVINIEDSVAKAEILNHLLVMPGHEHHQQVMRQIQLLRSPSSIPYIRTMLESGYEMLEYTCSEPGVITKWFSHALADIDTPESIDLIREYSGSEDPEIAGEMAYRLMRINR